MPKKIKTYTLRLDLHTHPIEALREEMKIHAW